jgi:hypothetical protein
VDYELIPLDEKDPAYNRTPFLSYARARRTDKEERDPDVGDSVHFWDMVEARCRAAVVTQDDLRTVWLNYLMPGETSWRCVRDVPHDETKTGPSWHWPCGGH